MKKTPSFQHIVEYAEGLVETGIRLDQQLKLSEMRCSMTRAAYESTLAEIAELEAERDEDGECPNEALIEDLLEQAADQRREAAAAELERDRIQEEISENIRDREDAREETRDKIEREKKNISIFKEMQKALFGAKAQAMMADVIARIRFGQTAVNLLDKSLGGSGSYDPDPDGIQAYGAGTAGFFSGAGSVKGAVSDGEVESCFITLVDHEELFRDFRLRFPGADEHLVELLSRILPADQLTEISAGRLRGSDGTTNEPCELFRELGTELDRILGERGAAISQDTSFRAHLLMELAAAGVSIDGFSLENIAGFREEDLLEYLEIYRDEIPQDLFSDYVGICMDYALSGGDKLAYFQTVMPETWNSFLHALEDYGIAEPVRKLAGLQAGEDEKNAAASGQNVIDTYEILGYGNVRFPDDQLMGPSSEIFAPEGTGHPLEPDGTESPEVLYDRRSLLNYRQDAINALNREEWMDLPGNDRIREKQAQLMLAHLDCVNREIERGLKLEQFTQAQFREMEERDPLGATRLWSDYVARTMPPSPEGLPVTKSICQGNNRIGFRGTCGNASGAQVINDYYGVRIASEDSVLKLTVSSDLAFVTRKPQCTDGVHADRDEWGDLIYDTSVEPDKSGGTNEDSMRVLYKAYGVPCEVREQKNGTLPDVAEVVSVLENGGVLQVGGVSDLFWYEGDPRERDGFLERVARQQGYDIAYQWSIGYCYADHFYEADGVSRHEDGGIYVHIKDTGQPDPAHQMKEVPLSHFMRAIVGDDEFDVRNSSVIMIRERRK